MMTFMKKEINYKPINPAAFVMALGYKLGNEDIGSDKAIESLPKATEEEKRIGRHFYPSTALYLLDLSDMASMALKSAGIQYKGIELDSKNYDGYFILDDKSSHMGKININLDLECQIELY